MPPLERKAKIKSSCRETQACASRRLSFGSSYLFSLFSCTCKKLEVGKDNGLRMEGSIFSRAGAHLAKTNRLLTPIALQRALHAGYQQFCTRKQKRQISLSPTGVGNGDGACRAAGATGMVSDPTAGQVRGAQDGSDLWAVWRGGLGWLSSWQAPQELTEASRRCCSQTQTKPQLCELLPNWPVWKSVTYLQHHGTETHLLPDLFPRIMSYRFFLCFPFSFLSGAI